MRNHNDYPGPLQADLGCVCWLYHHLYVFE
jgi:hypothetical protein